MQVLLLSTYDLGRQPFGLASPAAWLRRAGAQVECLDLAVEQLDEVAVGRADIVAFYLPMHTATRLAARVVPRVRALNPRASLCFYGLYAPLNEAYLRSIGGETILGGEYEAGLVRLFGRLQAAKDLAPSQTPDHHPPPETLDSLLESQPDGRLPSEPLAILPENLADRHHRQVPVGAPLGIAPDRYHQPEPLISLAKQEFLTPDRIGLPPLERYARVDLGDGTTRVVGYTEASRGCKHFCRHCPVVPVYEGQFRIVGREIVLEDIRRQVAAGAEHITFGDPDFFNGIGHALALVRALHEEHPRITYDATIKIEHLLDHARHIDSLRETGCLFVTTAVESIDDRVLALLGKGHTKADFLEVVRLTRQAGLTINPTFIAFTPWITIEGYLELLALLDEMDLVEHVSPVQLAMRLLIPAGSKLLELDDVQRIVGRFDDRSLIYPWRHEDPKVDRLQADLQTMIAEASSRGEARRESFARSWRLAERASGSLTRARASALARPAASTHADSSTNAPGPRTSRAAIPFLTEPWYC